MVDSSVKNFDTYIDGQVRPVIYQQFWIQYGAVAIEVIKKMDSGLKLP